MRQTDSLRIVLVSTERAWRGGEAQAGLLAEGLRQRGHRVAIVARKNGQFAQRMAEAGFPVEAIAGRGRGPGALWSVRSFLRQFRPDVLHANDSPALTCAGLASWRLNIPARIASRRVVFPIRSPKKYLAGCDRVVCVSHAVAEVCVASGVPLAKLRVVHDGVDPRQIAQGDRGRGRRSVGVGEDQPLLVTIAALTDDKGHRYLLEAARQVVRQYPEAIFAWAGAGELEGELRRLTAAAGLENNVRFLGFRRDTADLIQAADAFVMASHLEGLCSSVIDAMLAGRAIVATAAGGIPELIGTLPDERPRAWMAPPKDAPALAEALLACLASPQERRRRGQRAQRRALGHFTAEHMVNGALDVYHDALEPNATRRAA